MSIDNKILLTKKIGPLIYIYIMIVIITTLSLIILFMLFNYKVYYNGLGTVILEDDKYYLRLYVPLDSAKIVTTNNTLMTDNKNYKYRINRIDNEFYADNNNTYQVIYLDIELEDKNKYNNLVLKVKFLQEDKRVLEYLKDLWRCM